MIIEQAFNTLPEILCGSRYPGQEYEGGVVIALTLAILQELNGRNVPNPLSCIKGECLYSDEGFSSNSPKPRPLRADLVLDTFQIKAGSKRLGTQYGWRHNNWLEAKFFKRSKIDKQTATINLLCDLLRLSTLIKEVPGRLSSSGRYLLHVYDHAPNDIISFRRNKNRNAAKGDRIWAEKITLPGLQNISIDDIHKESPKFTTKLGRKLKDIKLTLSVSNYKIEPINSSIPDQKETLYWCILSRINSVECTYNNHKFSINSDRVVDEVADGDFECIREVVGSNISQATEINSSEVHDPALLTDPDDTTV